MRPTDSFRIIRFSDRASEFTKVPQLATPENIADAQRYAERLTGHGGTHMDVGIR